MEQKQQYFYNLIDIYCKVIFMPEINYINENFSKELLFLISDSISSIDKTCILSLQSFFTSISIASNCFFREK